MAFFIPMNVCPFSISSSTKKIQGSDEYTLQSKSSGILSSKEEATRRQLLVSPLVTLIAFNCGLTVLPACAKDEEFQDKDEGVAGAIKSLFDPNEKTKSGKVLPKDYLKSAREVVTTLRESVKEDPNDMSKFRRTADAAKESIREYLGGWRGQKSVVNEESYVMLEKAIRSLASFYSKAGPSAPLPEEIKLEILDDLNKAEEAL
ncbi:photosystem II D1 precursor processing protein PSB27-H2, chloroplastic [Nicotiana tomentosiformis]|uniref:photosystem II D1 precursor processing protein PSB27-H2, chloroplastic n=1 Tax=Nicotiana tomentosiformis TaxID=4098 RepID=UPI00051B41A9|nr:photosystem II D1 precursor processing protein PSB27-H2, chloroplastic [Nicotiana tomentosiformis]